jgi:hypothetical protein
MRIGSIRSIGNVSSSISRRSFAATVGRIVLRADGPVHRRGTVGWGFGHLASPQPFLGTSTSLIGRPLPRLRWMSSTSAAGTSGGVGPSGGVSATASGQEETKKSKNDKAGGSSSSNLFLDNLGKIFLAAIASVIATLVRSSYNTSNRNRVRDWLQEIAALDPVEIEDLRTANSHLTPDVFRAIMKDLAQTILPGDRNGDGHSHGSGNDVPVCTYHEFVFSVRKTMARLEGQAFTVQLGHLIDRVVADVMEDHQVTPDTPMPVSLWLTALSLSLNSSVRDRIRILNEVLQLERNHGQQEEEAPPTPQMDVEGRPDDNYDPGTAAAVTLAQIRPLVGYLQSTCQLPPDTQIVATDTKYPTQQWERGRPGDLVPWEGSDRDVIDLRAFASILRSRSVCAWGECYQKRKFDRPEDV